MGPGGGLYCVTHSNSEIDITNETVRRGKAICLESRRDNRELIDGALNTTRHYKKLLVLKANEGFSDNEWLQHPTLTNRRAIQTNTEKRGVK